MYVVCVSKKSQSNYFTHGIIIRSPVRKTPLKFINFILSEIKYTIVLSMIIFVPSLLFSFIVSIFFFPYYFFCLLNVIGDGCYCCCCFKFISALFTFLSTDLSSLPTSSSTNNKLSRSLSLFYMYVHIY